MFRPCLAIIRLTKVSKFYYLSRLYIEKNKMGGACGAYGGGERCAQGSSGETGGKETTGETQT